MFKAEFDHATVDAWVEKHQKELPKLVSTTINNVSAFGLSTLRRDLPKRSVLLANSYTVKKESPIQHVILSPSKYADGLEFGYKAHIVTPKGNHKFLMFANNKGAAKLDGSVKAAAARKPWKKIRVSKKRQHFF